jgi:hypothetical protein
VFSIPTQDYVLGYSQPSLRDLFRVFISTQDYVLGYSQPSLRDLFLASPIYELPDVPFVPDSG